MNPHTFEALVDNPWFAVPVCIVLWFIMCWIFGGVFDELMDATGIFHRTPPRQEDDSKKSP